ncbi:response regulator transcription factor [Flavobacteriales bacterium]|nr:response regulator transcription factor [Flavobacteriales bacterium]MDC1062847.1 response regulator transcription factor [Flavobacteriales bacterium]
MKGNIIIIDDHKIFGEGFCSLLENNNFRVKRVFQSPKKALHYLNSNVIEIVFCDINMPEINGLDLIKKIKKINSDCKVIMISMYTEKNIIKKALENNADGYLTKNCSIEDIKTVISNNYSTEKKFISKTINNYDKNDNDAFLLKYKLTKREKEIISHILKEKSNSEIGELLQISKRTVETHRKNIMLKLDVKNSIGIAVKALKHKLV